MHILKMTPRPTWLDPLGFPADSQEDHSFMGLLPCIMPAFTDTPRPISLLLSCCSLTEEDCRGSTLGAALGTDFRH